MSNIAGHASSTAINVFRVLISIFPVHSLSFLPLHMSESPWYSYFLTVFLANAIFRVGPQNKIAHSAHSHKRFKQVPVVSADGIEIGTKEWIGH